MIATINNETLLKELKKMSLVIKKNTVLPILTSVLFEFDKNKLTLTGTDTETTYILTMDCTCKDKFSVAVEYLDIVDVCSNAKMPITMELKETNIALTAGKYKSKLPIIGTGEQFPKVPTDSFDFEMNVDFDFFYGLANANTCRSKEDLKVNLNMAAIDIQKQSVTVVGTDANFLYKKTLPIKSKKEFRVMVCDMFIQSCKSFQDAKISIGEKFIKAESKNETIISRLSDNKFVSYEMVIPKEIEYNATVNKDELKASLKAVTVASNIASNQCVFNFNGTTKISSQNIDFGKEAEIEVDVEHKIDITSIACNVNQLIHLLNLMEGDSIELSITAPNKTIYLRPEKDETTLCLLQPLMITIQNN